MKQRDNRWRQARLGDVTASRFKDVLAKPSAAGVFDISGEHGDWWVSRAGETVGTNFAKKADAEKVKRELVAEWQRTHWSATAESYLNEKLSELIHCQPADVWRSDATDWGTANEPNAFEAAIPVIKERFGQTLSLPEGEFAYIHHPTEPHIGCSPDGLPGDDGLLELKCPYNGAKWIAARRSGLILPAEHKPQVQGSLWVTGRSWYAYCWYDQRVMASGLDPLLMIKVDRDDDYIDNVLAPRICAFRDYLRSEYDRLTKLDQPF